MSREGLIKILNLAKPALSTQAFVPILTHFCFDGTRVIAHNDVLAIGVRYGVGLEFCAPGELLQKMLSSLVQDKVEMAIIDTSTLVLSGGRSRLKLPTLPVADFTFDFPTSTAKEEIILTPDFISGVEKCLVSVGSDPTHPAQMGVTVASEKGHLVLYSTDNFTISRYKTDVQEELPEGGEIILPTTFCEQLVGLSKAFPHCYAGLRSYAGALVVTWGTGADGVEAELFTKIVVDLEPMDFQKILKRYKVENSTYVDIPEEFDLALQRALLVLEGATDKVTSVTASPKRLTLHSESSVGDSRDVLPFGDEETDVSFYIDPEMVLRGSKVSAQICVREDVLLLSGAEGRFLHMIAHCHPGTAR